MAATRWIARYLPLLALFAGAALPGRAAAQAGVPGVVTGRVIPAGGGDVRGVRVFARAGAAADSVSVDSAGRFALMLTSGEPADSVELWIDSGDSAARAFQPARLRLGKREMAREQEIVLVPARWTIRAGRYAGREVDVSLSRAFTGACARCSGFYRRFTAGADSGRTWVRGWPAERFPLRVAFDRDWNGEPVSARDSAAFWNEADGLDDAFGADIFRPANFHDAAPREDGGPDDVILVWIDPEMQGISGLGTAVSHGDDIQYGDMRLNRGVLREASTYPGLVAHELVHTLGFGHTCGWRSVVADVRRCPNQRAPNATEEDVAYVQLAAELRALLSHHGSRWAVEAALAAIETPRGAGLAVR